MLSRRTDNQWQLSGALTYATAVDVMILGRNVISAAVKNVQLVFNLNEVNETDSASVALIVDWLRFARNHGIELKFINIPSKMMSLIQVSGVSVLI